jgi:prevent-host-death family protein
MRTVNIHEAKTHLSKLVEEVAGGETVVVAKAGKPMVRIVPLEPVENQPKRRYGMLAGQGSVPDDIKTMFKEEIEEMFYGKP